jgi:hypothetical protein
MITSKISTAIWLITLTLKALTGLQEKQVLLKEKAASMPPISWHV